LAAAARMPLHRVIEQYDGAAVRCRTAADLLEITIAAARELGFDRVALVHGLWFRQPGPGLIKLDNYGSYGERFEERGYYRDDPVHLAGQRTNAPFAWDDLRRVIPWRDRHGEIMRDAELHGLRRGLSVPSNVLGEPPGVCSFATSASVLPSRWHRRAICLIGTTAFREARRLWGFSKTAATCPTVSPRKLEILRLAAMGKTDPEIAIILGLSASTVETYMRQLRQTFDVYSRTQLCIAAFRLGLLAFEDAMSGF